VAGRNQDLWVIKYQDIMPPPGTAYFSFHLTQAGTLESYPVYYGNRPPILDASGHWWAMDDGCTLDYEPNDKTGAFRRFGTSGLLSTISLAPGFGIVDATQDKDGRIWATTRNAPASTHIQSHQWVILDPSGTVSTLDNTLGVRWLLSDPVAGVWSVANQNLYYIRP